MVAVTRPLAREQRERIEQHVDALEHAQFADEHDVGRVGLRRDLGELLRRHAIVHDAHQRARRADLGGEHIAAVAALEQEQLGARASAPARA